MNNFEELQKIWQGQDAHFDDDKINEQFPGLVYKLERLRKRQWQINIVKTLFFCTNMVLFLLLIKKYLSDSPLIWGGMIWIILSGIIFMIIYWKNQLNRAGLDHTSQSISFLQSTILRLQAQKRLFKVHFPRFLATLLIGLNMLYAGLLHQQDPAERLMFHAGMSLFLIGTGYVGLKVRMYRLKKEVDPLIEELQLTLEEM